MGSSPLVNVIVWPISTGLNVSVLPAQAVLIVDRKDPEPLSLLFNTRVGPQLTVIVAVAKPPPSPPFALLVEACTWKLPFAFESTAGVNFNPALPSAAVMKSPLLIKVKPSCLNSAPLVMLVILKLVTSGPSIGLRVITRPEVLCVSSLVVAFVTDGVSATGATVSR